MLRKLVFLFLLFLGTFTYSFAQTDTNDEGTLEVTIPSTNPDLGETATPHAPSSPLATGYYDVSTDQLFLYFVFVPDNSVVTVTSTAGDICIQAVDPLTATVGKSRTICDICYLKFGGEFLCGICNNLTIKYLYL